MKAGVDDPVHVQVQIVKLEAVGVGARRVGRDEDASDDLLVLLDAVLDDERVSWSIFVFVLFLMIAKGEG